MTALDNAQSLWDFPDALVKQWENDESKTKQEKLIAKIIGPVGNVVDLGCGIGRFSKVLKGIKHYQGYDSSSEMIHIAKQLTPKLDFACVDITSFQTNQKFDTGICIDVAYHQKDPIAFIKSILNLWDCQRLFFTLLVGDKFEELLNSIVINRTSFLELKDEYDLTLNHIEKIESFDWVLCCH